MCMVNKRRWAVKTSQAGAQPASALTSAMLEACRRPCVMALLLQQHTSPDASTNMCKPLCCNRRKGGLGAGQGSLLRLMWQKA
jgi:hypothetical protein